jgi:glyoxylase-like metal-dependent hydrolase (beta-lactamase superfamily II)
LPERSSTSEPVTPIDEALLGSLGIFRFPIPVPFADAGGPVNAYAILDEGGSWSLFDAGVGTAEGIAALDAQLAAAKLELAKLSRIIVSHGHIDHYGNAERLARATGVPVWLHPDEVHRACGDGRWFIELEAHRGYYRELGVPEPHLDAMVQAGDTGQLYGEQLDQARLSFLAEGQAFRFARFEAQVRHFPGHTPGLVCLHAPEQRLLFSDDHLLAKTSPNPLLDFVHGEGASKFRALATYLTSAARVRELELDAILPGHGPSFRGHRALLDGLEGFYAKRQAKVRARLEQGAATAFELVTYVFPRWDAPRLYLMLSEVVGALEVLEDLGQVRRSREDGHFRFSLSAR